MTECTDLMATSQIHNGAASAPTPSDQRTNPPTELNVLDFVAVRKKLPVGSVLPGQYVLAPSITFPRSRRTVKLITTWHR